MMTEIHGESRLNGWASEKPSQAAEAIHLAAYGVPAPTFHTGHSSSSRPESSGGRHLPEVSIGGRDPYFQGPRPDTSAGTGKDKANEPPRPGDSSGKEYTFQELHKDYQRDPYYLPQGDSKGQPYEKAKPAPTTKPEAKHDPLIDMLYWGMKAGSWLMVPGMIGRPKER